ncbi:MAG: L,D-transpeptidase [Elusimicrobia bacterium]|nr:L,D-transpeptidase [Elusimicrobiota bacterium]
MDDRRFGRRLYGTGVALWLLIFAYQVREIARWAEAVEKGADALLVRGLMLDRQARDTVAAVRQSRAYSDELGFLQELPNLFPKDKGYLRTQKAIAEEVQGLRRKLGGTIKGGLHIVVDAKANKLYLKKGFKLLMQADCSVGRGGVLLDKRTGRRWEFVTPRGEFRVIAKAENPLWRKPDWAYTEAGEKIPPPEDPSRLVQGELGAYVLNLGDGYLIHGTKNEELLGRPASHGCVRLGAAEIAALYEQVPLGTKVYIVY